MVGSSLLAATLAALPVLAEPKVDPARWVLESDIPRSAQQATVTTFDLTIDEEGRPVKCTIVINSGSDALDEAVCNAVIKRSKFKPAKDTSGAPILSVRRDRVQWRPDYSGGNSWYDAPDFVVSTSLIDTPLRKIIPVVLIMNDGLHVDNCVILESSKNKDLDELACAIVRNPQIRTARH